ncbi:unnamed protein product, partial [Rotaria sp. Silwood1]
AHILQFQFYRAMCRLQGVTKRLHMCDIYGNKDVGKKFKEMLSMGCSKSWSEILESLTGENKLESKAMLDYFQPLYNWLKMENLARDFDENMTNFIILLLFISSFQFSISNRKQNHYDQKQFEEIIEILKIKFTDELEELISTNYNIEHHNDNPKQSENYESEVDSNDHVDIKLWNKLNEKDMKKMPVIAA